ncbi:hypothetical protein [Pseudolabrys taiwanensis]|nr:hypothetical protein [Pseudolabrys taiwanensis]
MHLPAIVHNGRAEAANDPVRQQPRFIDPLMPLCSMMNSSPPIRAA